MTITRIPAEAERELRHVLADVERGIWQPPQRSASVEQANKNLRARDLPPLPEGITPHSLRRTFASVLYAIGEDPGVVMDEMGHTDPALALRVYRQSMRRGEDEKAAHRRLVEHA